MARSPTSLRQHRIGHTAAFAAVAAVAAIVLSFPISAIGKDNSVAPPPAVPTSADQIQNIDQVKTAIKGYYGDTVTNMVDPVPNAIDGVDKLLHTFSPTGSYANEMAGVVADAEKYLRKPNAGSGTGTKAILFDVDDTTLNTYNYEIYSNFVYNPTTNEAFVNACLTAGGCVFPAVPHMVGLAQYAESQGYLVFFLTGRPLAQHDGTVANLTTAGYDVVDNQVYLKDASGASEPWLASCAPCTTIQYKSLTRQHIESLGYDIVADFGDQFSDLTGGFADATFKLPNPTYFLP